jgi:hypothetical protein
MPLDAYQIAELSRLPIRQVRYVLEFRVLPGSERASKGHRVTRTFTGFESFGIALAALMLTSGVRRPTVAALIRMVTAKPPLAAAVDDVPLLALYNRHELVMLDFGDFENYRIATSQATGVGANRGRRGDNVWIQGRTGVTLEPRYEPAFTMRVHVPRLRDPIRRASRE